MVEFGSKRGEKTEELPDLIWNYFGLILLKSIHYRRPVSFETIYVDVANIQERLFARMNGLLLSKVVATERRSIVQTLAIGY